MTADRSDRAGRAASGTSDDELTLATPEGNVRLRYVEMDGGIHVLGRDPDSDWPIVLLRRGEGTIHRNGRSLQVRADLVSSTHQRRVVLSAFEAKYGVDRFRRWFPLPGRLVRLDASSGVFDGRHERTPVYRRWLAAEFDAIAPEYAARIERNPVERYARRLSVELLTRRLASCHRLLEIGAGTGLETLTLLANGHAVTAIDVSAEMLSRLTEAAARGGVGGRLVTRQIAAAEVGELARDSELPPTDGAYSTFGALNCEPDLGPVARGLAELLRPGAPLVTGVFNRSALGEFLWSLVTLDGRKVLARRRLMVPVGLSRFQVDFYPHDLAQMQAVFGKWFDLEEVRGFPVLVPPADRLAGAAKIWERIPGLLALDAAVGRGTPLARWADHLWLTWVRNATA